MTGASHALDRKGSRPAVAAEGVSGCAAADGVGCGGRGDGGGVMRDWPDSVELRLCSSKICYRMISNDQ